MVGRWSIAVSLRLISIHKLRLDVRKSVHCAVAVGEAVHGVVVDCLDKLICGHNVVGVVSKTHGVGVALFEETFTR